MDLEGVSVMREEGTEVESLSECLLTMEVLMLYLVGLAQDVRETERGAVLVSLDEELEGQTAGRWKR